MSFSFIDLFAGIGGLRIPFDELGGKCVFSSEIDRFARRTYSENFGDEPFGDITKIKVDSMPRFDLLLAGFPCQPFSQAGMQLGFEDTRGTLFFNIAEIIKHHKPKAVLLENVKRLKTHDKGKTYQVIKQTLENLGYTVFAKILAARDFGVPQIRERIYIVALRDSEKIFEWPTLPRKETRVGDILESEVDEKYTISDRLWEGHKRRKKAHQKAGNGFGYSLFTKQSPYTSTISARYYKDGSEILICQGTAKNPRRITPREAARLQGFPENYRIVVSDTQSYKQFGNSVCVPVIRAIANSLAPHLYVD